MTTPLTPIPARVRDLKGDVSQDAPSDGQALVWDSTEGQWVPAPKLAPDGDGSQLTGLTQSQVIGLTGRLDAIDRAIEDVDVATIVRTSGSYGNPTWLTSLAGSKVSGNIPGNAANVTGTVAVSNGGTGATSASTARDNLGVTAALASKANDADVVHKTGAESIAGPKTLTDPLTVTSTIPHSALSFESPGNPQLRVTSTDERGVVTKVQSIGGTTGFVLTETTHDLWLGTGNTPRAAITSLGNVLVNATSSGSQGGQLEARSPDASTPIFAGYDYLGVSRFLVGPDGTITIQGRVRSNGNGTLSGSGAAEIANVASFGWSFQSLAYGFYAADGTTPYFLLEGAKATLWLPLVLPELPDASIPNGGLAWSSTSPGELRARTPAGTVKTVTMT